MRIQILNGKMVSEIASPAELRELVDAKLRELMVKHNVERANNLLKHQAMHRDTLRRQRELEVVEQQKEREEALNVEVILEERKRRIQDAAERFLRKPIKQLGLSSNKSLQKHSRGRGHTEGKKTAVKETHDQCQDSKVTWEFASGETHSNKTNDSACIDGIKQTGGAFPNVLQPASSTVSGEQVRSTASGQSHSSEVSGLDEKWQPDGKERREKKRHRGKARQVISSSGGSHENLQEDNAPAKSTRRARSSALLADARMLQRSHSEEKRHLEVVTGNFDRSVSLQECHLETTTPPRLKGSEGSRTQSQHRKTTLQRHSDSEGSRTQSPHRKTLQRHSDSEGSRTQSQHRKTTLQKHSDSEGSRTQSPHKKTTLQRHSDSEGSRTQSQHRKTTLQRHSDSEGSRTQSQHGKTKLQRHSDSEGSRTQSQPGKTTLQRHSDSEGSRTQSQHEKAIVQRSNEAGDSQMQSQPGTTALQRHSNTEDSQIQSEHGTTTTQRHGNINSDKRCERARCRLSKKLKPTQSTEHANHAVGGIPCRQTSTPRSDAELLFRHEHREHEGKQAREQEGDETAERAAWHACKENGTVCIDVDDVFERLYKNTPRLHSESSKLQRSPTASSATTCAQMLDMNDQHPNGSVEKAHKNVARKNDRNKEVMGGHEVQSIIGQSEVLLPVEKRCALQEEVAELAHSGRHQLQPKVSTRLQHGAPKHATNTKEKKMASAADTMDADVLSSTFVKEGRGVSYLQAASSDSLPGNWAREPLAQVEQRTRVRGHVMKSKSLSPRKKPSTDNLIGDERHRARAPHEAHVQNHQHQLAGKPHGSDIQHPQHQHVAKPHGSDIQHPQHQHVAKPHGSDIQHPQHQHVAKPHGSDIQHPQHQHVAKPHGSDIQHPQHQHVAKPHGSDIQHPQHQHVAKPHGSDIQHQQHQHVAKPHGSDIQHPQHQHVAKPHGSDIQHPQHQHVAKPHGSDIQHPQHQHVAKPHGSDIQHPQHQHVAKPHGSDVQHQQRFLREEADAQLQHRHGAGAVPQASEYQHQESHHDLIDPAAARTDQPRLPASTPGQNIQAASNSESRLLSLFQDNVTHEVPPRAMVRRDAKSARKKRQSKLDAKRRGSVDSLDSLDSLVAGRASPTMAKHAARESTYGRKYAGIVLRRRPASSPRKPKRHRQTIANSPRAQLRPTAAEPARVIAAQPQRADARPERVTSAPAVTFRADAADTSFDARMAATSTPRRPLAIAHRNSIEVMRGRLSRASSAVAAGKKTVTFDEPPRAQTSQAVSSSQCSPDNMLQPPSSARSQHSPDKTPTEDEIEALCRNVKQCLNQEGHACGRAARRLRGSGASSSSSSICKMPRRRHNAETRSEQDDGAGSNTTCSKAFSATLRANAGGVKRLDVVKAVNARQVSTEHLSDTPPVAVTTLPSVVPHNSEGKSLLTNWQELNTQKLGSCSGSSTVMTQVDKHTIGTLPKMTRREKTHRRSVRVNSPRTVRPGYAPMFKSKDTASNRSTVKAALQGRPTAEAAPQGKPTAEAALQGRPMAEAALQGRPMAEAAPQSKPRAEAPLQGRPMAEVPLHGKPTHEARLRVAPAVTIPLPVHPITAGPLLAWPVAGETAMSVQGAGEPDDSLEAFMTAEMLSEDSILTEKQLEGNISTRREKSAPARGSARTDIDMTVQENNILKSIEGLDNRLAYIQKQYSSVQESNVKKVPVIPHPPSSHRHSNSPARQRYGNPRHRRIVSGHSTTAQQKHQAT